MSVTLEDLTKLYSATGAGIKDVSAEVQSGEWVALLGPSGCGKSTLLKIIAGLEEASSGILSHPWSPQEISFVFQEAALLPWLTVRDNVFLPYRFRKVSGTQWAEIQTRTLEWIEKLRLTRFLDAFPSELSGGMKMRVSLARALATQPKLLLLDEPFAALDEPIRMELGLELRELWLQHRPTVFFVTHSITEALSLSDRVMVMQGQPGTVVLDEALHFGEKRNLSLRARPEFTQKVEMCFELLRGQR